MKHTRIPSSVRLGIAVAATLAAMGQSAEAAIYIGSFDPLWGANVNGVPNIGYQGSATFYVPDACLSQSQSIFIYSQDPSFPCDSIADPMRLVGATVDLYQSTPANVVATLQFGPVTYGATDAFGVYIELDPMKSPKGQVAGFNALLGPASVSGGILDGDTFFLQFGAFGFRRFEANEGETFFSDSGDPDDSNGADSDDFRNNPSVWQHTAMYLAGNCTSGAACSPDPNTVSAQSQMVAFQQIPTPQTWLLTLVGLAAAASLRRRRG